MTHNLLHKHVGQHLLTYNIVATVIACDPELADTAAFCEHYGYSPEDSANTIIVASKGQAPKFAACLILASTKLDVNKKVSQLLGAKRLSFATAEQTKELTDMQIGGVVVVGLPDHLPIYVDKAVFGRKEIILGGGNRTSKLLLDPAELLKLPQVQVIEGLAIPR